MVVSARLAARRATSDFEILVVDDGSTDGTADILDELLRLVPELKVVRHPDNRGYGAALRSGFEAASKELVFYTDGDAQFDPREMPKLLAALRPEVDYVSGYRRERADPILRVLIGNPYHRFIRAAFGLGLRDIDCDFRLFRREHLERARLEEVDGSMCIELLKKLEDAGLRFAEVPVRHYPRVYGRSQYFTLRGVLASYWQLLRLWNRLVLHKEHLVGEPLQAEGAAPVASSEPRTAEPASPPTRLSADPEAL
jgi:glycosyltransferase involved in cell wall biosynthesis